MPNTIYKNKNIDNPVIVPVIFAVETSDYVSESSKTVINTLLKNCIEDLKLLNNNNIALKDYDIRIAILDGKEGWITGDSLFPVTEYEWKDLSVEAAEDPVTQLMDGINEDKLFSFETDTDFLKPCIMIVTDGGFPMDGIFFTYAVKELWKNPLYQSAHRFVISVDELVKEQLFVNLVHEGTYLEITEPSSEKLKNFLSDLLMNVWLDSEIDIAEKYQESVIEKKITIEK